MPAFETTLHYINPKTSKLACMLCNGIGLYRHNSVFPSNNEAGLFQSLLDGYSLKEKSERAVAIMRKAAQVNI